MMPLVFAYTVEKMVSVATWSNKTFPRALGKLDRFSIVNISPWFFEMVLLAKKVCKFNEEYRCKITS
jgi:hypothetical protein